MAVRRPAAALSPVPSSSRRGRRVLSDTAASSEGGGGLEDSSSTLYQVLNPASRTPASQRHLEHREAAAAAYHYHHRHHHHRLGEGGRPSWPGSEASARTASCAAELEESLQRTVSPVEDPRAGDEVGGSATWNSLNYDEFINDASIAAEKRWKPRKRRVCFGYSGRTLARWVVTCAIGVTMGAVAIGLGDLSDALLQSRDAFVSSVAKEGGSPLVGMAAFVAWGTALGLASSAMVSALAPGASGSGIPQVKAYLNGVRLEGWLSIRVFLVKFVGTALSVGSGASLGPEGPLVHLGAVSSSFFTGGLDPTKWCSLAAILRSLFPDATHELGLFPTVSVDGFFIPPPPPPPPPPPHHAASFADEDNRGAQAVLSTLSQTTTTPPPPFFRSDVDRRDFLSIGAACGFSAAFGAPIGGVLFSLEEASSYWSNELLWRSLVGAVLSTFTALALKHCIVGLDEVSRYGLITLRGNGADDDQVSLALVPVAALFGAVGGVVGAVFNAVFYRVMRLRQRLSRRATARSSRRRRQRGRRPQQDEESCAAAAAAAADADDLLFDHHQYQHHGNTIDAVAVRVADATLGIFLTSIAFYGVALAASPAWACVDRDRGGGSGWLADKAFVRRFNCEHGQVHELASLWFGNREKAIKKILEATPGDFSAQAYALSGALTLATLALSFGSALPGGLFLPLIFAGASFGAAFSSLSLVGNGPFDVTRRHTALLGAVALLAGVQRSTVSLCVIMLEGTNSMNLLIPIIVVVCTARFVGNSLGDGLYEIALHLQGVPFLDKQVHAHLGLDAVTVADALLAGKPPPVCLPRRPNVAAAAKVLEETTHGAYPVVDDGDDDDDRCCDESLLGGGGGGDESKSAAGAERAPLGPSSDRGERGPRPAAAAATAAPAFGASVHARNGLAGAAPHAPPPKRKLVGLVLREHLNALRRASHLIHPDDDLPPAFARRLAMYAYDSGTLDGPRASEDFLTHLSDGAATTSELYLDLERVMIRSPHVVYDDCPVTRAYRLFVTMGARHLLVINHDGDLVGILTRHDMCTLAPHAKKSR